MRVFLHWIFSQSEEETYGQRENVWTENRVFFGEVKETGASLADIDGKSYQVKSGEITLNNYPDVVANDYLTDLKHGTDWYVTGVYRADNRIVCTVESYGQDVSTFTQATANVTITWTNGEETLSGTQAIEADKLFSFDFDNTVGDGSPFATFSPAVDTKKVKFALVFADVFTILDMNINDPGVCEWDITFNQQYPDAPFHCNVWIPESGQPNYFYAARVESYGLDAWQTMTDLRLNGNVGSGKIRIYYNE